MGGRTAAETMRVKEIKRKLSGERLEYDCELLERSDRHAVLRYRLPHAAQVADLTLPDGTVTYAHYWTDRSFNVYHWIAPDGRTLAYYVNLGDQVALHPDRVEWRDLAVDILVTSDGRTQILDTDELEDVPPGLRREIDTVREQVLAGLRTVIPEVAEATRRLRTEAAPQEDSDRGPRTPRY